MLENSRLVKTICRRSHQIMGKISKVGQILDPSFGQPGLATMPKSLFILAAMSGLPWDGWVLGFCWRVGIVTRVVFFSWPFHLMKQMNSKWDLVTSCEDGIYWLSRKTFSTQREKKVWETLKRANVEVEFIRKDFHPKTPSPSQWDAEKR